MYSLAFIFIILQYFLKDSHGLSDEFIEKEKEALRYGFHQTYACQRYEKAFKCIRKCLDEKFDVAYADKNCACTCYYKKEKEKYRYLALQGKGMTPPTTKLPAWAQPSISVQDVDSEEQDTPLVVDVKLAETTTTLDFTLSGNDTNGTDTGNATLDVNADDADAPAEEGEEGDGEAAGDGEGEGEEKGEEDEGAAPEEK